MAGGAKYPQHIWIVRPHDDYQLAIRVKKLTLNETIARDRFDLPQPPDTELVRLDKEGKGSRSLDPQMIVHNVLHRPMRTLIRVIAVAVEVMLVLIIVGLTSGLVAESAKRIEGVGADMMVQPPSASVFMAFSGAPMPIRIRDHLEEMKYVK